MLVRTVYFKVACVVSLWFWSKQQPWNNAMYWPCKKWTKSQTIKEVAGGGGRGRWSRRKETLADKPHDFENPACQ